MRIADYPFSREAADYVRLEGISLDSLIEKSVFIQVRRRALERVLGAISGEIPDIRAGSDNEIREEVLSYPLARVIISCLNDNLLIRRYAVAEAKLAYSRMKRDKDKGDMGNLALELGLDPRAIGSGDILKIHFADFIRSAHRMRSPKWKLVNRDLQDGFLTVTREELMRLMEEMVKDRVLKGLPLKVNEETCKKLDEYIKPVKSELEVIKARQRVDLGKITEGAFPPCIKKMLTQVQAGTNLAHSARFALTSFMLQINMPVDQVVGMFNTSPDFDEERTRYQVEHIAGASGTKYRPPACTTMMTYGNCPGQDELCRRVNHPLSYYERRIRFEQREGQRSEVKVEDDKTKPDDSGADTKSTSQ